MAQHEVVFVIFSYLLGAVPVGFIVYYISERKDIRGEGSGNIGATNVLRTKGRSAAIFTLIFDMVKGVLPVIYGIKHFDSPVIVIAGGLAAVLGHLFPIYLKFKGGKGVATFFGVLMVFHVPTALGFGLSFLIILYFSRYVSAGSIGAIITAFFFILFTQVAEVSMLTLVIVVLLILKHRQNIYRMASKTENQFLWKENE